MKDLYQNLAQDYDEFGIIDNYSKEEQAFLEGIFSENNVKKVLDCACGTGQHLLMLSESGYQAAGSDYSEPMLDMAKKNLEKRGFHLPLKQCDFRFLESVFTEKYDAVLCMNNSLPHLSEDEDLVCALRSMKNRLNDRGLLILSTGTTEATLELPPVEVVINREDFSRIYVKEYDGRFQTITIVDLFHSKERTESRQHTVIYRALLADDYKKLLKEAGFHEISFYGDYRRTPYGKNSWKLIAAAR